MEEKSLDHKEILSLLPHRYPFLFLDRVIYWSKDPPVIEAIKCFTMNEAFFQGHFPGEPVVPGVILVEALAQLGMIFLKKLHPEFQERLFFLAGVEKARFRRPVFPGEVARLKLQGYKLRKNIVQTSGKVLVDEELAAEAQIIAAIK